GALGFGSTPEMLTASKFGPQYPPKAAPFFAPQRMAESCQEETFDREVQHSLKFFPAQRFAQLRSGCRYTETGCRHSGELDFPLLEQPRGALRIHRPAEIISLSVSAAGGKEKVRLSLSLHALGYNLNTKLLGKANCGAHHGGIARIGSDPEDELLREFQAVDG